MKYLLAAMLALALTAMARAAIDTHEFGDEAERTRYRLLTEILRCPKCQNQTIAESNSPIANDLRGEVYRMLGEGQSDTQIVDFMVARYGDFVLYEPPLDTRTLLLWLGPAGLLLIGAGVLGNMVLRARRARSTATALSPDERQRLNDVLRTAAPSDGKTP